MKLPRRDLGSEQTFYHATQLQGRSNDREMEFFGFTKEEYIRMLFETEFLQQGNKCSMASIKLLVLGKSKFLGLVDVNV